MNPAYATSQWPTFVHLNYSLLSCSSNSISVAGCLKVNLKPMWPGSSQVHKLRCYCIPSHNCMTLVPRTSSQASLASAEGIHDHQNSHSQLHTLLEVAGNHQMERHELFLHKSACLLPLLFTQLCIWILCPWTCRNWNWLPMWAEAASSTLRPASPTSEHGFRPMWSISCPTSAAGCSPYLCPRSLCQQWYCSCSDCPGDASSFPWPPPHHKTWDYWQYQEQLLSTERGVEGSGWTEIFL